MLTSKCSAMSSARTSLRPCRCITIATSRSVRFMRGNGQPGPPSHDGPLVTKRPRQNVIAARCRPRAPLAASLKIRLDRVVERRDVIPLHDIPEGRDVVGAAVLVFEV